MKVQLFADNHNIFMEALSILLLVLLIAAFVLVVAGIWKTFEKAGEAGWKALIPIYNIYVGIRLAGRSGWWLLTLLLPMAVVLITGSVGSLLSSSVDPSTVQGVSAVMSSVGIALNLVFIAIQAMAIISAVITYDFARSYGKGLGFTLGLSLLGFIFWPILGFGDSSYLGPAAAKNANDAESAHANHEENHMANEG